MRRQVETILKALLAASLAASLLGCAAARPPQRIQDTIHTANRYMPEYVAEANKALAYAEHPDQERLRGMGDRLAVVEVAGEYGKPSYGAFNIEHLNLCRQNVVE